LSIFSSDKGWKPFFRLFVILLAALFFGGYAFIVVVDPYDSLPFSPRWDRVPVDRDQAYFYPALARAARFDSAVIGTSTVRLLKPDELNPRLNSRFVNLAMNAASVFEQETIFNIFLRYHPNPKTVIFGIDHLYFVEKNFQAHVGDASLWPEWLYDKNPYNNWPPYRFKTLEHAWREFLSVTGLKTYKYGRDGYTDFTKPLDEYDLNRARVKIYGTPTPKPIKTVEPPVRLPPETIRAMRFPQLEVLSRMLDKLPAETVKVLFITPFHHYAQPPSGSEEEIRWREFLRRLTDIARNHPQTWLLDFNIVSPVTTVDSHYWDQGHYTVIVASQLAALIEEGIRSRNRSDDFVRLYPTSDATAPDTPDRMGVAAPQSPGGSEG
jgi:hypothetical protein